MTFEEIKMTKETSVKLFHNVHAVINRSLRAKFWRE